MVTKEHIKKTIPSSDERISNNSLEIPRADPLLHALAIQVLHQRHQPGLRHLQFHGAALDGLDFGVGGFLFGRGGEGVDVVEDVDGFVDGEGGAHFAEHVVLGFACEGFWC